MQTLDSAAAALPAEFSELRSRLEESEEVLRALRSGEADAITVETPAGVRVFTLNGAEQPYRVMVEAMSEGAVTATPDGIILYCNQRFADMLRADLRTVIGASLPAYFADDGPATITAALLASQKGVSRARATLLASDATRIAVTVAMHSQTDRGIQSVAIVVTDLTEWQRSEATRDVALRALRMLHACNVILVRASNETEMLAMTCRAMVDVGGYPLAWVGFAEHDEAKTVRPVAYAGRNGDYVSSAQISWADTERGRGPTGTVIRTGRMVIARDTNTQTDYGPWRELAQSRGYRSSATMPLRTDHEVFGALMVYSGLPDAFDDEEAGLLAQLADDLAFGIVALRNRQSRSRLAAIVESAGEAIVGRNLAGTVTSWNRAAERMFGYTATEMVGQANAKLIPREIAGEADWLFDKVRHGETVQQFETIRQTRDGRRIAVLLTYSPLLDAAGNVIAAAILMHDNTARKNAEEALQFRERVLRAETGKLRSILDSMAEAVVVADARGNIIESNPAACHMHGVEALESTVEGWANRSGLHAPECRMPLAPDQNPLVRALQGEATDGAELCIRRQDGSDISVEATGRPMRAADGSVSGGLVVLSDITARRASEVELSRHRQHLEELVAARTEDLAQANVAMVAANQELESFAYSVSHDLRTPLRAIDGFSQMVLEDYGDKLDAEGKRLLLVVRDGATRMARLIEDILGFSRISRQDMAASDTDMAALVQDALRDLAAAMAGRAIELKIAPLPHVHGDADMLQRVWTNLLDNAIKFTAKQARAVIKVGVRAADNETVFFVKDNGAGFDMQNAGKLFGVFQRLHAPADFPGSGIGLAIVKRIVTRHGGRVWAEASPGAGATFYFTLPASEKRDV